MHLQAVIFTESFLTVRALIGTLTYKIKAGFLSEKSTAAKQACTITPPAPGLCKHLCMVTKRLRQARWPQGHFRAEEELSPLLRRGSEPQHFLHSDTSHNYRSRLAPFVQTLQSSLTPCDPMDSGFPGSSVHGSLQARILQWVAVSSSKGSSWPRNRTCIWQAGCFFFFFLQLHFIFLIYIYIFPNYFY